MGIKGSFLLLRITLATISLLLLTGFGKLPPNAPGMGYIDRFSAIEEGLYRGAQPNEAGIASLQALGVRTIVNLRTTPWNIAREEILANRRGIRMISLPLGWMSAPQDEHMRDILSALTDPSLRPVFVHCRHGKDRTGLVAALYRYFYQDWAPEAAYQEMLTYGFDLRLRSLRNYFFQVTGWRPMTFDRELLWEPLELPGFAAPVAR